MIRLEKALDKFHRITDHDTETKWIEEFETRFELKEGNRDVYGGRLFPYVLALTESSRSKARRVGKDLLGIYKFDIAVFEVVADDGNWSKVRRLRDSSDAVIRVPTFCLDIAEVIEPGELFLAMDDRGKKFRCLHFGVPLPDPFLETFEAKTSWVDPDDETYFAQVFQSLEAVLETVPTASPAFPDFPMVDRTVLLVRAAQPFLDWLHSVNKVLGPEHPLSDDAGKAPTAYLIRDFDLLPDMDDYVASRATELFENELQSWFLVPQFWPELRDFETFCKWFDWELVDMVYDMEDFPPDWYRF
jgi:hypothetical protein